MGPSEINSLQIETVSQNYEISNIKKKTSVLGSYESPLGGYFLRHIYHIISFKVRTPLMHLHESKIDTVSRNAIEKS